MGRKLFTFATMLLLSTAGSAQETDSSQGTIQSLESGVSSIRRSIEGGDYSTASSAIGSLYDDGGGGFSAAVVDGRGQGASAERATLEASTGHKSNMRRDVPPPKSNGSGSDEAANPWTSAVMTAAALAGALLLARNEPLDPNHRRDGGKSDNPAGDKDVQSGIERNERQQKQRELAQDPKYKQGFEDGRKAQEIQGVIEQFLNDTASGAH